MEYYISSAKQLCEDLEQLHYYESDVTLRSTKAAKQIKKTLKDFRNKIREDGVASTEDEVHFFKYVKPKIQAYLIFYSVLAEIESSKFHLSDAELLNLIDKKERMFRHIMRENLEFVKYYKSSLTHRDELYFLRETEIESICKNSSSMLLDPEFSSSHDQVASNIIAFDLFKKYLAPHPDLKATFGTPKSKMKWTCSKSDFVEFIYALQATIAVNHGDVEIKELCNALEPVFQIKIDDPYRTFIDIANRKTGVMKFIPKLEEGFLRKINEVDGV